ncbi:sugar ABC transporter ATP-binding protein [Ensifer adhaerens]|uniref:sugar ABC transporter ATP-binding protein n=1 Tax=Ensifer adhaerens TaxID=106592 RepID=UPI001CBFBB31|nr:sugar ABC transporter ATP-binding protein [Ensifer adhaerens]MBZ7925893.1 sugar ABC transporter ATP-binding protein [Ensifer adhaerens]UAX94948.1 sugar ABC transporter ATP-binding protein [Ensifer adhaerens]UAY03161.1 sugar ABC transporter ATP-binding protein [Ensifer adhaerens]UAY11146.1 sugar ABC transporter ATP-binding protein [Ensifer adhaerens]
MQPQPSASEPLPRQQSLPPFLEVRNVEKHFGGVRALKGVSFSIEAGNIYHLMGENGCGKSTLIKIISGAQAADAGDLLIDGETVADLTPVAALAAGIETVYQDFSLLPNLSVAENIGLTQQLVASSGKLARRLDIPKMRATAERALAAVGLPTNRAFLSTRTDELPMATRQLIAIARAIASDARLVIMDEPTTALTKHEVDTLIAVVDRLRSKGVAVLFVTHKLDECKSLGGRAIIMRDGQKVAECDVDTHSKADLAFWMTGKVLDDARQRAAVTLGEKLLDIDGLARSGYFEDVSFSLRKGEIVGITGLLDSGRNELALALAGVSPAESGGVRLEGKEICLQRPADAIASGIGYVPEDRLSEGLFLSQSIRDNIMVPVLDRLRNAFGVLDGRRSRTLAEQTVGDLQVASAGVDKPVQSLSGGNQQRVLIGRWLTINPKLLILHGPTVGVDVGSKDTIYRIIQRLAGEGMGVIIISDDLPELLQNCDRIMVMRKGRVVKTFTAEGLAEDVLYRALTDDTIKRLQ